MNSDFTGWFLTDAKSAITADAHKSTLALKIIETAPPPRKPHPKREPVNFGEWRVLRHLETENEIELTVAREQLASEGLASEGLAAG